MNGGCSSERAKLFPLPNSGWRCNHYSDRSHDFCVFIPRSYKDVDNFLPHPAKIWNSLSTECFPLTCDLNSFKSRISRVLLSVSSRVFQCYLLSV